MNSVTSSLGRYGHCVLNPARLSMESDKRYLDPVMLKIIIEFRVPRVNGVEIRSEEGFLSWYHSPELFTHFKTDLVVNPKLAGTYLTIKIFTSRPEVIVDTFQLRIPMVVMENDVCPICLLPPPEAARYVTPCGHGFCLECIFHHATSRGYFLEKGHKLCTHTMPCLAEFPCPICNVMLSP